MDTRHLEAFRAVYENGSMSAAAGVLKKSQPAISNLIARLEDEIGVRLFHRAHGRLEPTAEAETFFTAITRTLDAMDRTLAISRNLKSLSSATLLIAASPGPATFMLPPVVAGVLQANAGATVRFITRSSYAVRDLGAVGAFDIGFAELPIDIHVASLEVFETACLCVMRADHPLAGAAMLGPRELDSHPFVTLFPEHITHVAAAEAFFEAQAHWNVVAEVEFFGTACMLARDLGAVTLVDPSTARFFTSAGMVAVPFRPIVPYRFGMFRPSTRPASRISTAFMEAFRRTIAPDLLPSP